MASTAQVQANRSNAQKSTGPRTAEGKAVAAQNAVRHGLLAKEVVVKGEDPGEFEFYRQQMLAELAPAGQMESMLAHRIVGLSWRLRRAERLQAAAFDKIENQTESSQPTLPPEVASKMLAVLAESNWHPPAPAVTPSAFGRKAVQDFNLERVLDRLLVYERRIESSLYRTMAELRKLRKEGGIASSMGAGSQTRDGAFGVPVPPMTVPDTHGQDARDTHGRDAHATKPDGGTPHAEADESCETNPIGPEVSSAKSEVSSVLPTSNVTLETSDKPPEGGTPNESRQTNPIGAGALGGPVPGGAEDWSDLAPGEIRQTKPIQGPGSTANNTPSRPRRIRKFPNTVKEETYDSYLGRWVWTGYAFANKDSKQADSGRRQ